MKNKEKSMLFTILGATLSSVIYDPYSDLPEIKYSGSSASRKVPLTKKAIKARAASKRARKARRNNR